MSQCLCERISPHARRLVKETHTCTGVTEISWFYVYEGLDVVAKLDNQTGEMIYFSRGLGIAPGVGDVLAESHIASNGSLKCTYLYVQNHRGDTIALVSNSTVVARYEYGAWGNVVSHTGPDAWLTFSGKHYDSDAGLYYYGYRWYDPQAKRWTQPDPSGLAEGLDLYQFCGNDPVNNVDVDGKDRWVVDFGHPYVVVPIYDDKDTITGYKRLDFSLMGLTITDWQAPPLEDQFNVVRVESCPRRDFLMMSRFVG